MITMQVRDAIVIVILALTSAFWCTVGVKKAYDAGYKQSVVDLVTNSYVNYDGSIYNYKLVYASSHCGYCHYRWKGSSK
jgi:hypothetical protein